MFSLICSIGVYIQVEEQTDEQSENQKNNPVVPCSYSVLKYSQITFIPNFSDNIFSDSYFDSSKFHTIFIKKKCGLKET